MLNEGAAVADDRLKVLDGIELQGRVNTEDDVLLSHIRSSIRRGHRQIMPHAPNDKRVVLVGGGPSLESTFYELRQLIWEGAELVTLNGAYHWCIERNLQPKMQIIVDARDTNARFLEPEIPKCIYTLASQCHPAVWDAVEGRERVFIFHAAAGDDPATKQVLDDYYGKQWYGVGGGTTAATRALSLLRTLGYMRFDFFGIDSCWMENKHHAYEQAENRHDKRIPFKVEPTGRPDLARIFLCAPWHVKQAEDFLQEVRINGDHFLINVHGDGLLHYLLHASAEDMTLAQIGDELSDED